MKTRALGIIEAEYKQFKFHNTLQKAQFLLSVNWNEINETRAELGLPKISNDSQRKAYLRDKFSKDNERELMLELKYNSALREYEDEKFNRFLQMHTRE